MVRSNKKIKVLLVVFISCLAGSLIVNIGQVYAEPPAQALKKFEAYGLYTCMRDHFRKNFTQEQVEEDFFNDSTGALIEGNDDNSVSLPAGSNLRGADNYKINCTKLTADLIGANSFNENPYGSFVELLEKFGYDKQNTASGGSKCKIYKFQGTQYMENTGLNGSWHDAGAIEYCESSVEANGTIKSDSTPTVKVLRGDYLAQTFKNYDWEPLIGYLYKGDSSKITYCINYQTNGIWADDCSHYDDDYKTSVPRNGSWSTVSAKLDQEIAELFKTLAQEEYDDPNHAVLVDLGSGLYIRYNGAIDGSSSSATANSAFEYKITNVLKSFKKAYKNIWNEDFSSNKFSESQQAGLYQNYVLSYWEAETKACADTKSASMEAGKDLVMGVDTDNYYHQTKLYKSDGTAQYCYAKTEKWGNQVYGITDSQIPSSTEIGFAAVAKWLLDNGPDKIDPEDTSTSLSDGGSNGKNTTDENTDPCYNAGVEGMSWIICPALNNASNTVDGIEGYLRDWLQIKTVGEGGIFENGNGTHLYDGWSIFRNLANGLLIIVLLIIIFSQLTGYGIDNYGIKKMLPKLILMGILINLSFLFCQLAVDISNILGVGLDNMMKAIAANMNGGTVPDYTTSTIVTAILGAIAGAGAVAGVAAGAIGDGGVMIAIVLLLALLVALIAVLMFFVMLSARIIIVAVFIVISPVAFALYILPNTQNLFKKWWKIFEAALVIYPICGALYGASYIIKAIVGGDSGGFIPGIIAVVAPFLPFLTLPTLLKSAMAGLGALGGTLTMLGNGLRKGAQSGSGAIQSGIKGSERYKNSMQDRARNRQIKMMDRGIDRLQNKRRPLTGNEELRLARMQQTQDKLRNEDRAARAIVEQNRTKDMDLSGLSKEWNDAWEAGNKEKLDAMTSVINSRYGAAGANEIAKRIATKNIANDENSQSMMKVLQNNMNHDSTLANNMRNKASDAYGMISDGGKDGNGNYQNLRHFTDNNEIAKSDKDWSTQSSATLQRAIDSGRLTKEQIKRILNSSDTSIQSGLDDDKRKVLRDAVPEFTTPVQSTPITSGNAMTDEAELNALLRQQRQNNESGNDKRSPGGVILP